MPKDDRIVKYGAVYVPEEKVKETAKRGAPKSSGKMAEIEEIIRQLQDEMKKSNRDNLDALYNIDEDNISSSYRKKIDGRFVEAYAAIQTWAEAQEAGFSAVAKWQDDTDASLAKINATATKNGASIQSLVSWQNTTEDKLKGFVEKTSLNASIGSYISNNKASIVSAVTGSFVKVDTNTGITTTSDVISKISQEVSNGIGKLTLSVSNGTESSTISLMNGNTTLASKTITLSGLVSFTDLSTAGSTQINGANIITGTLSADAVDVNNLKVKNVWFKEDNFPYTILTSELSGTNSTISLGIPVDNGWAQGVYIYGTTIAFKDPGDTGIPPLYFDMVGKNIVFTSGWTIGTVDYNTDAYLDEVYADRYYFDDHESYLTITSSGTLRFHDADGNNHDLT